MQLAPYLIRKLFRFSVAVTVCGGAFAAAFVYYVASLCVLSRELFTKAGREWKLTHPKLVEACVNNEKQAKQWTRLLRKNQINTTENWAFIKSGVAEATLVKELGLGLYSALNKITAPATPSGACAIACRLKCKCFTVCLFCFQLCLCYGEPPVLCIAERVRACAVCVCVCCLATIPYRTPRC